MGDPGEATRSPTGGNLPPLATGVNVSANQTNHQKMLMMGNYCIVSQRSTVPRLICAGWKKVKVKYLLFQPHGSMCPIG